MNVTLWNSIHPVGTPVVVTLDDGRELPDTTRSAAWEMATYLGPGGSGRGMVVLEAAGPQPIGNVRKVRAHGKRQAD